MSNEEENRCPLCAEEMDWTDQQFKPCNCGYQVCVWCWHHIMDMAEKDETEGRCPACRVVYEKEKIVAMQADCERMAGASSNRKTKPPKAKPKTNEVKKDLTNVRVIQRKMAYVIGLPLSLADEHLLQRKEYFGQYGRVTKISLSRTAGGTIQQFVNETCSVYVTFSKEEEALRCIQSVHGFILEDRELKASFGTAKYCHAWMKGMPCNNSACLYLHTIGADEDSFGKDEIAAVHTRSRVQEIVGTANTLAKRAGRVLPYPVNDLYHTPIFPDKSTIGSPVPDGAHGSIDTTCMLSSRERVAAVPHKMTTFVDVVGRPNSSGPDKNGVVPDDRAISNLSSELSSVSIGGDIHPDEPYTNPPLFRTSSTNLTGSGLFRSISNEPLREDPLLYDSRGKNDSSAAGQRAYLLHSSNTANMLEDSSGSALLQKTQSLNDFSVKPKPVHNHADVAFSCVNTLSTDASQEMKFQNSAKSDRIYRSSNSFSNEEIVEHLRRIDGDNLMNDEENSASNVVKNSIISNIMSIDFDSCDSLALPSGLSDLLDEPDVFPYSSWSSSGSDQSVYSFVNQDGYASQIPGPVLPDFMDKKDQYLCNSQYPVTRTQNFTPPGFTVPARDPPPGFSSCERTSSLPRPSSGNRLVNPSLSTNMLQQPSKGSNTSIPSFDFNDPAILSCGKPTNEAKTPGFGMRQGSNPQMNTFDDDARLWLLIQQQTSAYQDSKFSQAFAPQMPVAQDSSYTTHMGLSSGLLNQHQNYNPSPIPQQKYSSGHISNNTGYLNGMEEFRDVGVAEVERNERLGLNNYYAGYGGDMRFNSPGDLYSRVFGL